MLSSPLRRYADQKLREYCEREGIAGGRFETEAQLVTGFASELLHQLAVAIAVGAATEIADQLRLRGARRRQVIAAAADYAKRSKDWDQFPLMLTWASRGVHKYVTHPLIRSDQKKREIEAREPLLPFKELLGETEFAALPAMLVQRDKAGHDRYIATHEAPAEPDRRPDVTAQCRADYRDLRHAPNRRARMSQPGAQADRLGPGAAPPRPATSRSTSAATRAAPS